MNTDFISDIEKDAEELRQALPDPFDLQSGADRFFSSPVAEKLIGGGEPSVSLLMGFLETNPEPALTRPVVLLLSRFAPDTFYQRLLKLIKNADQPMTQAFDAGLWRVQIPEGEIARDLVDLVIASGSPNPLLLLQRPAANSVRPQLEEFIKNRVLPLSLYALYCLRYALRPEDIPLLSVVSQWFDMPEISALSGLYLLKLGSKEGLPGIRTGLLAREQQLRTATYYELSQYLSATAVAQSGYNPLNSGETNRTAADVLLGRVRDL